MPAMRHHDATFKQDAADLRRLLTDQTVADAMQDLGVELWLGLTHGSAIESSRRTLELPSAMTGAAVRQTASLKKV